MYIEHFQEQGTGVLGFTIGLQVAQGGGLQ